jgi:hypothetical protein
MTKMENNFADLKQQTQEIIDLIVLKNYTEANFKLAEVSELLDELFDFSDDDADLVEISKYQVLLNQLHQKINSSNQ